MNKLTRIRTAALLLLAVCLAALPGAAQEQKNHDSLRSNFATTIRNADGSVKFTVMGTLTITRDDDGSYTGRITPDVDDQGNPQPSVVFRGPSLTPDPNVQSVPVYGQVVGRAISMVIDMGQDEAGNPYYIFGTGASKDNLSKMPAGDITGIIGGSAVTTHSGEVGDWISVTVCVNYTSSSGVTIKGCVTVRVFE